MKAIVTGACGFMGSHLVDRLIEQGYTVIATDLENASRKFLNARALFIPADLASEKEVNQLFSHPSANGASWLFHVAALFDHFQSVNMLFRNNVLASFNLIREFAKSSAKNKRLILWSSGSIYGDTSKTISADEDFLANPRNNYSRSKLEQERILKSFIKLNPNALEAIILRPGDVIGSRSRYGVTKLLEFIAGGQMQFYLGKKNITASVIHVDDVVGAAIHLAKISIERLKNVNGIPIFNIVDNSRHTLEELFDYAAFLLKDSHNARILKFHMPLWPLRAMGRWQEFLARKHRCRPLFSPSLLDNFENPIIMNNFRLLATGYEFRWPDSKDAISDTLKWYLKEGWIK